MPIIPPPEIRDIVEKTAQAVARNGPAFEARIRESEKQNSKFSFLNPMDPYREYYDERVAKLAQGDTPSTQQPQQAPQAADQEAARAQPEVPAPDRPPPPSFLHLKSHPPVSASDQDIIALTARFTAAYGRQAFTTPLASREARNFQFEFLRPGHSLHAYFNALVDAYSDIRVHAQNKYIPQLAYFAERRHAVLEAVAPHIAYTKWARKYAEDEKRAREEEADVLAAIDWHAFMVLDTVEFTAEDDGVDLPPGLVRDQVEARSLAQRGAEAQSLAVQDDADDDDDGEEMDVEPVVKRVRVA
ncbi:MAG: hypothetical protein SGCHY_002675 [Lobulomycetales sp.]